MLFDWEIVEYTESKLVVQLDFENSLYVASHPSPDELKIRINNLDFFVDVDGMTLPVEFTVLSREVPPQLDTGVAESLESTGTAA